MTRTKSNLPKPPPVTRIVRRHTGIRRVLRYLWWAVSWTVVAAILVASIVLVGVPRALGGTSLVTLTGSMSPLYMPGDVVAVDGLSKKEVCSVLREGDIVTFMPNPDDPTLITHRVKSITHRNVDGKPTCRVITRGDANSVDDAPLDGPKQIRARAMYHVPHIGKPVQYLKGKLPEGTSEIHVMGIGLIIVGVVYGIANAVLNHSRQGRDPEWFI